MFGLKVSINGAEPILCGADDLSVLTAGVTLSGGLGERTDHPRPGEPPDIWIRAGGLTSRSEGQPDEHLRWIPQRGLEVGDVVLIEVARLELPPAPVDRAPAKQ